MSEIALFGTDVTTDWVNGYNMIMDDSVICGALMCTLPFAPMAIVGPKLAYNSLDNIGRCCRVLVILTFYIPCVVISTPIYMGFVLFTGVLKLWNPNLEDAEDFGLGWDGDDFIVLSSGLRISEIVTESCPQSILGEFNKGCRPN